MSTAQPHITRRAAVILWLLLGTACMSAAVRGRAQNQPYIGYVYPAGGRQGSTFTIRVGGQGIDECQTAIISGKGVTARLTHNYRRLNNQELQLLNEQLSRLKRKTMSEEARAMLASDSPPMMMMSEKGQPDESTNHVATAEERAEEVRNHIQRIEKRTLEFVQNPACSAISSTMILEVTIHPEAEPGEREIRLITARGLSNPMAFHVGKLAEFSHPPMLTSPKQVLGKEAQALRRRTADDRDLNIALPCTVNGQISSGEIDRYTFEARKGQKLVISTLARQLVPFIADAVPGWFQPVLTLLDANGQEVAYNDDFRFKPDPVLVFDVPADGQYSITIHDSLYRGREDFVYRISVGELPFITSVFPLGRSFSSQTAPEVKGWNLEGTTLMTSCEGPSNGVHQFIAHGKAALSNPVLFASDPLPDVMETEPNDTRERAQMVELPRIVNGRISRVDDRDVYQFVGKAGQVLVAEIVARRLDSALDSLLKVTDEKGNLLAVNDDFEDLASGIYTHQADSYVRFTLPNNGKFFVHVTDTARQGGEGYAYRLRLSEPMPSFELRVAPSSLALRSMSSATVTIYAMRKDGYDGPIELRLKDPPSEFACKPMILASTQTVARLTIRTLTRSTEAPVNLVIIGRGKAGEQTIERQAVAADDRMQAFLWRHLVPASALQAMVFDPAYNPPPQRLAKLQARSLKATATVQGTNNTLVTATPPSTDSSPSVLSSTNQSSTASNSVPARPQFTKPQVAGRLKQLKVLFEEGMLSDDFYAEKVAEIQVAE